jgi:hypothetical protein
MPILSYAFAALITWFFECFIVPRVEQAKAKDSQLAAPIKETTNSQKIHATRQRLDELKKRLGNTKR